MKQLITFFLCFLAFNVFGAEISAERQKELLHFLKHDCGSCHGMTLQGGLGPALLPEFLADKPIEFLIQTILDGRENTAMPPWRELLTEAEVAWLAETLVKTSEK